MKAASEQSEGHIQRTAPLLTVKETAAYLHMSESWVNQSLRKHFGNEDTRAGSTASRSLSPVIR